MYFIRRGAHPRLVGLLRIEVEVEARRNAMVRTCCGRITLRAACRYGCGNQQKYCGIKGFAVSLQAIFNRFKTIEKNSIQQSRLYVYCKPRRRVDETLCAPHEGERCMRSLHMTLSLPQEQHCMFAILQNGVVLLREDTKIVDSG